MFGIAYAQGTEGQQLTFMQQYSSMIMIAVVFLIFYFLVIRPNKKKQQQQQEQMKQLKAGDRIMLNNGFYGTVENVSDNVFYVNIASGITVQVSQGAIAGKVAPKTVTEKK